MGQWKVADESLLYSVAEPILFYDNGKSFLYLGSGNSVPLIGLELDTETFFPMREPGFPY